MNLIFLSSFKCNIIFYIVLISLISVEGQSSKLPHIKKNFSKSDWGPLFDTSEFWPQGDIPLLNRKIFRANRVTIREHPYIASVRRNIMHYTVATMLTKNIFITVAHPLINAPIDELTIVVGENYADRGAFLLSVLLMIIHEDFDQYTLNADIALLRVFEDMTYRSSVKSIQLIHPRALLNGLRGFVTGWGRCDRTGTELCLPRSSEYTPGEKFDPMLRTVSFLIREPNPFCDTYRRNGVHLAPGMLCIGIARHTDRTVPCLAVPGAPLVVNGHLVGVQSFGFGCGYEQDLPLIYTSVQYFQPWLLRNIPILRRLTRTDLHQLFEGRRAYMLTKWIMKTRVKPPKPLFIDEPTIETLMVDESLAGLRGQILDIRDFIFNGTYRKHKQRIYERLKKKFNEKEFYATMTGRYPSASPFLNFNVTKKANKVKTVTVEEGWEFADELEKEDSYSDRAYVEYVNDYSS